MGLLDVASALTATGHQKQSNEQHQQQTQQHRTQQQQYDQHNNRQQEHFRALLAHGSKVLDDLREADTCWKAGRIVQLLRGPEENRRIRE